MVLFHTERLALSGAHGVKLLTSKGRGTRTCRNPRLTGRPNHVQNQSHTAAHECISLTPLLPVDPGLAQRGPQSGGRQKRRIPPDYQPTRKLVQGIFAFPAASYSCLWDGVSQVFYLPPRCTFHSSHPVLQPRSQPLISHTIQAPGPALGLFGQLGGRSKT